MCACAGRRIKGMGRGGGGGGRVEGGKGQGRRKGSTKAICMSLN